MNPAKLDTLARHLQNITGTFTKTQAELLIGAAKVDSEVSEDDKGVIAHVLDDFHTSAAANATLSRFLSTGEAREFTSEELVRGLADQFVADGPRYVIDKPEAWMLIDVVRADGGDTPEELNALASVLDDYPLTLGAHEVIAGYLNPR